MLLLISSGHVQDRKSIQEVIQLATAEKLLLLVDEVIRDLLRLQCSIPDDFFTPFAHPLLLRCTRTAYMDRTQSSSPTRRFCLRWAKSSARRWSWFPSIPCPVPLWQSKPLKGIRIFKLSLLVCHLFHSFVQWLLVVFVLLDLPAAVDTLITVLEL